MASNYQDQGDIALVRNEMTEPQRETFPVGDKVYVIVSGDDVDLFDMENARRIFVRLWEIEHAEGDEDGLLDATQRAVYERLDQRMCEIALYGVAGDEGNRLSAAERVDIARSLTPRQRQVARNLFFKGFAPQLFVTKIVNAEVNRVVTEMTESVRATAREVRERNSATNTEVSVTPSKPKSKRARTSPAASATATAAA